MSYKFLLLVAACFALAAVVYFTVASPTAEQSNVSVTNVTYIVEDGQAGIGIKASLSDWVGVDEFNRLAQRLCQALALQAMNELLQRKVPKTPTFVEVDAKVPRSLWIISFNVGQVRRFDYQNDQCSPAWRNE